MSKKLSVFDQIEPFLEEFRSKSAPFGRRYGNLNALRLKKKHKWAVTSYCKGIFGKMNRSFARKSFQIVLFTFHLLFFFSRASFTHSFHFIPFIRSFFIFPIQYNLQPNPFRKMCACTNPMNCTFMRNDAYSVIKIICLRVCTLTHFVRSLYFTKFSSQTPLKNARMSHLHELSELNIYA